MGDFSQAPEQTLADNQSQGYVGLHIEQGVPILDSDLNLLQDLLAEGMRTVFAAYVGDGAATDSAAFQIVPMDVPANDFRISGPGGLLAGGRTVSTDDTKVYSQQRDGAVRALTPPPAGGRTDTVYLEVRLTEVTDADVAANDDLGVRTSVRLKVDWVVLVEEGGPMPGADEPFVTHTALARLDRPGGQAAIDQSMITDLRARRLNMSEMQQRIAKIEKVLLFPEFVPKLSDPKALPQFAPQDGPTGQGVTLNGRNFDVLPVRVRFDPVTAGDAGVTADPPVNPSPTQIVISVPAGLVLTHTYRLTVITAGGSTTSVATFRSRT